MDGGKDPDNRRCMDWSVATDRNPTLSYYRRLAKIRNGLDVLQSGEPQVLASNDEERTFAYARTLNDKAVVVAVNAFQTRQDRFHFNFPHRSLRLPAKWVFSTLSPVGATQQAIGTSYCAVPRAAPPCSSAQRQAISSFPPVDATVAACLSYPDIEVHFLAGFVTHETRAFTLIELLVVIAIIAILAAILFPVFAQAKAAAKKAVDLSNLKQIGLSMFLYGNDYDSGLPDAACINDQTEGYILAAKVNPYAKNLQIYGRTWACPMRTARPSTARWDHPESIGAEVYMKAPNDPCVGLPASIYPTGGGWTYLERFQQLLQGHLSADPDYMFNPDMWSYQGSGLRPRGLTGGYSQPLGPNLDFLAPSEGTDSTSPNTNGLNGIGNGTTTSTSNAKAILLVDGPTDNTWQVGTSPTEEAWWGLNYKGAFGTTVNAVFFVSLLGEPAQTSAMHPQGLTDNGDHWKCDNCNNTQYVSPASQAGQLWMFWGTTYADPTHQ